MANVTKVTIVGGGLAGMCAALRLLERGYQVTLLEGSERLGGKAGANEDPQSGDFDEHGYHIFPMWYRNIWELVDQLELTGNFVDCTDFKQLDKGNFPRYKILRNITSLLYAWGNLTSGVLPFPEMFLFVYSTIDLLCERYSRRALLDQQSVNGFIRSRFYRTERVAREYQDLVLKGISVPSYEVSAMTMKNVISYWVKYPVPMYRILKGNLQEWFIQPLEQRLIQLGCRIDKHQQLLRVRTNGSIVSHLELRDVQTNRSYEMQVDNLLLAIPADKFASIIDDDLYAADPNLARVRYIRSRPMAALNIYCRRKLVAIPKDHVNLLESRLGLSFVDVSQTWEGYKGTVLNIISSDFTLLAGLSPERAERYIIEELMSYIPSLRWEDIAKTDFQPHIIEPLFMNDAGVWQYRPDYRPGATRRSSISNLYLAGDYCCSHVDLVSMEGAVTTGLIAAEALRKDTGGPGDEIPVLIPDTYPPWLMQAVKFGLLPIAAFMKLLAWSADRNAAQTLRSTPGE